MLDAIGKMTNALLSVLDGDLHSVWLYGSVVQDDFRLGWSDIDILVLTEKRITEEQARALVDLRQALSSDAPGNPYFRAFEGIAANREEYLSGAFSRLVYWGTTGQRITDRYQIDPFSQYELATVGRSVYGSDDRSIFPLPDRAALVEAIRGHYETIRKYAVQTDERLYSCGWLLDICRCIYTLRENGVIAKTRAGSWALENHLFRDEEPLRRALEIRKDPLAYRDRDDVRQWLKGLGPTVQEYADVLEHELSLV